MNIFENFRLLRSDMINNGWVIEAFPFRYKDHDYIILAKLYKENEEKPQYALLKLEILKLNDVNENLIVPVNTSGFIIKDIRIFREFFNIDYSENIGEILQQFSTYFSRFIPPKVNPNKVTILKNEMIRSLSKSDSEDPNKVFCYAIKRNPNKGKRSSFNDNKSRLLRSKLHSKFEEELTVSFCYSTDATQNKTDEEIIKNFSNRA